MTTTPPILPDEVILTLYQLQDKLHRMFTDHDPPITYWAEAGTVLGTLRHSGLIPWDDDLDLGVWQADMRRYFRKRQWKALLQHYDLGMYLTKSCRCKIFPLDGEPLKRWRYPTADIYAFEEGDDSQLRFAGPAWQQRSWGKYAPTIEQVSWLENWLFGRSEIWVYRNAAAYLDRRYGASWSSEARTHRLCHRTFTRRSRKSVKRWKLRPEDCVPARPMPEERLPPYRVRRKRSLAPPSLCSDEPSASV